MAGVVSEEPGMGRSVEGILSGQRCQSGEALAEWRSSEQVENGTPSTSPPYWDTDDEDDGGPKPGDLYGKYTWKIEKFSQINKRELRSNPFEVGGYKWYILIYPQGCDVCNHLSLFLCVANHDKLLPGWSHFAQFTIAVVNKDPKKSKYSDTLHRFWKKEHDWGWKKFMELSKVSDGFLDATDTLIIKAQVQVIREKTDRPFRCLDCQYRRELVRVYLTNVEQICRRFVEERRSKLGRLIDDKDMWSSFREFWKGMDRNSRRCMSREKTDVILKVVVKHFFIEKEVTSTLVMDSLYSGLKALESQSKCKKGRAKLLDVEEMPAPIVCVEKDVFVLVDDVLHLIERAAMEPLPPKDEKGPQNRTKEGSLGEDFNKDSIERDERRLTELGRRTVEIFILAHIFNHKIEVAYQEAVALKRQEELIREEELAAWMAESDQKAKRSAVDKEKKVKKKQAKQKRNNKKVKEKGREDRSVVTVQEKQEDDPSDIRKDFLMEEEVLAAEEKSDILEDASDVSDSVDGGCEVLPDSEDRDASAAALWDTDPSEVHQFTEARNIGAEVLTPMPSVTFEKRGSSATDDTSSSCSTDSVPHVVPNGLAKGSSNYQTELSGRSKNQQGKATSNGNYTELDNLSDRPPVNEGDNADNPESSKTNDCEAESSHPSLSRTTQPVRGAKKLKDEEPNLTQNAKVLVDGPKEKVTLSTPRCPPSGINQKSEIKNSVNGDSINSRRVLSSNCLQPEKVPKPSTSLQDSGVTKPEVLIMSPSKLTERQVSQQGSAVSRPSSAPLVPGIRPVAPVVSMVQTPPLLSRSVSAAGRLGPDPSSATHSYGAQSYRNVIMGNSHGSNTSGFPTSNSLNSSGANQPIASNHPTALVSASMFLPTISDRVDPSSVRSDFSYGLLSRDSLPNGLQWMDSFQRDENNSVHSDPSPVINGFQSFDLYKQFAHRSRETLPSPAPPPSSSGRQSQGGLTDEFPHLDIINDLLDDDHVITKGTGSGRYSQSFMGGSQFLNRQFSLPCDPVMASDVGTSSSSSSCRFERTRSYQDGILPRSYSPYDSVRDFVPQSSPQLTYSNGHVDGMAPSHWQMSGSDILVGMMNADAEASSYFAPDYSSLACGVNGYTYFRPSNGH